LEKVFIAYFDLLGFKQFLLNNTEYVLSYRCGHILRDIENALSLGKTKPRNPGEVIADRKETNINCLNVSDTIIFYSKDNSIESFKEFIKIIHDFNWKVNFYNFPVRGYATYDNFTMINGQDVNEKGTIYSVNLMHGKGLYNTHEKSELLNWAGCAIDSTIENRLNEIGMHEYIPMLKKYAKKYDVPYKGYTINQYALKFSDEPINNDFFERIKEGIISAFKCDNKSITPSVQVKIDNTIRFLESCIEEKIKNKKL